MQIPTSKTEFLDTLLRERAQWEALLAKIDPTYMAVPHMLGAWSVKDVIAHIMAYEQYINDRAQEVLQGIEYEPATTEEALIAFRETFGYPDFGSPLLDDDEPNAWIVAKYRGMLLDVVMTREAQTFATLVASIEELPAQRLADNHLFERIANNTYVHYHEHMADIRRWLADLA